MPAQMDLQLPRCLISRREALARCANGFGIVALASLLTEECSCADVASPSRNGGQRDSPRMHHAAKARSIIFLYMDGGPSQVDTFDPKPLLDKENGQRFRMRIEPTQFNDIGNILKSPWRFRPHGECGLPVSDLFPFVGRCADDLAVVRSMTSNFSEHTTANYFLHTGSGLQGRPSMGAWFAYGLGTDCQDLPAFVVLNSGLVPPGGLDNFNNGFLPATYQGSILRSGTEPLANLRSSGSQPETRQRQRDLLRKLDAVLIERMGNHDALESAIANYELAYRMQTAVPSVVDLGGEAAATKALYGLDAAFEPTRLFAAACLIARRLIERGVRFVELTCPKVSGDRWDQHSNLREGHEFNARAVDQPIAALLVDLKQRGLLDQTLVVWAGEFGRTPFAQGADGRDHNPFGFSIWLAGGGVRGGTVVGATDEYGYKVAEKPFAIHDLHATMLHLLGIDHTKLTFRFSGRDMRLTDVHGKVIDEVLA